MKFVMFRKLNPEDFDKVIEKFAQTGAIREKFPNRFPKISSDLLAWVVR